MGRLSSTLNDVLPESMSLVSKSQRCLDVVLVRTFWIAVDKDDRLKTL